MYIEINKEEAREVFKLLIENNLHFDVAEPNTQIDFDNVNLLNNQIQKAIPLIEKITSKQVKSIMDIDELCEYIGMAKSYVYKLTSSKKIAYSQPLGKMMYFNKEDIDKFLLSNRQEVE